MKVYVFPADMYACGRYRLEWPARALAAQGHDVVVVHPKDANEQIRADMRGAKMVRLHMPADCDVAVVQRVTNPYLAQAIPLMRAQGIAVVVDMDDDLTCIDQRNPAWKILHPNSGSGQSWEHCMTACREATYVTVSAPALLKVYAGHGRGAVLYNRVPERFTRIGHQDSPVIGWAGSVHSHPTDLQAMGNAVSRFVAAGHEFRLVGPSQGVEGVFGASLAGKIACAGDIPFERWPLYVNTLGVGVAPLADTRFNSSKCLDSATRVATRRGIVPIGELTPQDHVWNKGSWRSVQCVRREPATTGLKITMRSGREIRLTVDHKLWRLGDSRWTMASDLRPGDMLAMTSDEVGAQVTQRAPWPADSRASRGDHDSNAFRDAPDVPMVAITTRWARFLGLFCGDGCASGTQINISCDGQDADLIEMICEDFLAMGLWPATQQSRTWSGDLLRRRSVTASSANLVRFMRSLGLVEDLNVKRIVKVPEIIWRSPREIISAYLAGLFEADGHITSSGVALSTKYHGFALEVQRLLTSLGMESSIRARFNSARKDGPTFRSFLLTLRRAAADVFHKEVGFLSARKVNRLTEVVSKPHSNAYRPMTWTDEIVQVVPCWLEPIDVQVEGEIFAASGFISHNSFLKPLEYASLGLPSIMSPRAEYVRLHREHGIGNLAPGPREWQKLMRDLATNPGRRVEESARDRQQVIDHLTIEANAWRWLEIWETAFKIQRSQLSPLPI